MIMIMIPLFWTFLFWTRLQGGMEIGVLVVSLDCE